MNERATVSENAHILMCGEDIPDHTSLFIVDIIFVIVSIDLNFRFVCYTRNGGADHTASLAFKRLYF
jgi:hypothetical protein